LPSDTLYRHIKADDPPAVRFRTLVTWSAHRLKEASETQSRTASTEVRSAVSSIMDKLIADLVEKRIDLSWQAADAEEVSGLRVQSILFTYTLKRDGIDGRTSFL